MPWDKPEDDKVDKLNLPKHDYGDTSRCKRCGKSVYAGTKHTNKCTGAPGVRKVTGLKR